MRNVIVKIQQSITEIQAKELIIGQAYNICISNRRDKGLVSLVCNFMHIQSFQSPSN